MNGVRSRRVRSSSKIIQVSIQMLDSHLVIGPVETSHEQHEERLASVDVRLAADVLAATMCHVEMLVFTHPAIRTGLLSVKSVAPGWAW